MKLRWTRLLAAVALATGAALFVSAAPASAALSIVGYANFDGLAPAGCSQETSPFTVSGGWEITNASGQVEFCEGNLNAGTPPDPSHLSVPDGQTTVLQQDLPTDPTYRWVLSYTVGATPDSVTIDATIDGTDMPCTADTSGDGIGSCDTWFQPTSATTTVTITIANDTGDTITFDDLYAWIPS